MSHLIFACGARLPKEGDLKSKFEPEHRDKLGRGCLVVFDTDSSLTHPTFTAEMKKKGIMSCLGCPCRRKAGRKEYRCFHEDDWLAKHPEGNRNEPGRWVVTCFAEERE